MERKHFIKSCCITAVGLPILGISLNSCEGLHYATYTSQGNKLIVAKKEFTATKNGNITNRKFVLVQSKETGFPICLVKKENGYDALLMKCTHQDCELNVGGGIYTCPCHGSEFSITGKVLQGPAEQHLQNYSTTSDNENIYIQLV